jgi:hypothetical protein
MSVNGYEQVGRMLQTCLDTTTASTFLLFRGPTVDRLLGGAQPNRFREPAECH